MSSNVNIKWNDPNTYKTQPTKKQQIETDVKVSSATTSAAGRGATDAIIMGGEHKSRTDSKEHVTVQYKKSDGTHVTTKHVHT
ncbi:hypothetical protein C8Q74DRAFT_1367282 [Fomes fomentarius]|nr:hypothetical protein C8Q74DRAFT_1367282 [Fomes fomentarius]